MNTINDFITDFKNSLLVERICSKYDVIMIWLSGSNVIGLADNTSDYDLGVLVADPITFSKTEKTTESYKYKKNFKDVQCIYNSFEDIKALPCEGYLAPYRHLGWAQLKYLTKDHIIYLNPKYETIVATLLEHKECIAENAMQSFLAFFTPAMQTVSQNINYVQVVEWGKMLSHICWCVEELQNVTHDFEKLMILKRLFQRGIVRRPMANDLLMYAASKLEWAQQYLASCPDYSEKIESILTPLWESVSTYEVE